MIVDHERLVTAEQLHKLTLNVFSQDMDGLHAFALKLLEYRAEATYTRTIAEVPPVPMPIGPSFTGIAPDGILSSVYPTGLRGLLG